MGLADFSPDGSELGSLFFVVSLVDIDDSLSKVVLSIFGGVDVLDFEDGLAWVLILSVSFETDEFGFDPESNWGGFELGGVF
jgi:hypothetical protein